MIDWLKGSSTGKQIRLEYLCDLLGLPCRLPDTLHYQLIHRTASAIIEGKRFKTDAAAMVVHSFSSTSRWLDAFQFFGAQFKLDLEPDRLYQVGTATDLPLYIGWATGDVRFLREV
jgi:hypothetical protein